MCVVRTHADRFCCVGMFIITAAIANIVAGSTALSERALEAGAMEILVESLNANAEWAQVQANGCIALCVSMTNASVCVGTTRGCVGHDACSN
jgi:ADP-ribosylglycohydrolase